MLLLLLLVEGKENLLGACVCIHIYIYAQNASFLYSESDSECQLSQHILKEYD